MTIARDGRDSSPCENKPAVPPCRRRRNRKKQKAPEVVTPVIDLSVRLLSGEVRGPLRALLDASVWDLQIQLCKELGLHRALARCMSLVCEGRPLSPNAKLSACEVPDGATLQLIRTPAQFVRTMLCCPCSSPHPGIPPGSSSAAMEIRPEELSATIQLNNASKTTFTFGAVCAAEENAAAAFEGGTRDIVDGVMDGYSGSVIGWGETRTGKRRLFYGGSGAPPGLLQRAFACIASRIAEKPMVTHVVRASFLCVYLDRIYDLLAPSSSPGANHLVQLTDPAGHGATQHVCRSERCLVQALQAGLRAQNGACFAGMGQPSLMHALFTVTVEAYEPRGEGGFRRRASELRLCKLAGAEDLQNTQLCSLLGVMLKLAKVDKFERKPIPYNVSSIARLLRDSIGGSAQTCWIATGAPGHEKAIRNTWAMEMADHAKGTLNHPVILETAAGALPGGAERDRWPAAQA